MTRDEEFLPSIESDQMMYAFNDVIEEFKACRKFLAKLTSNLTETEFFWNPQKDNFTYASIAQHMGHIALTEKEVGKKAEINFSFRLDMFDDLFQETESALNQNELPSRTDLITYAHEIHECFLDEIRYYKKADLLFALVNHNYKHIYEICNLLRMMEKDNIYTKLRPESSRIECINKDVPYFKLPIYAN